MDFDDEYIRELEAQRDKALAENFYLTSKVENLHKELDRMQEARKFYIQCIKKIQNDRAALKKNISALAKELHKYTGK
jgi:chromosome segregation ATPase